MGETPLRIRWNSSGIYHWFKLSVKYSSVARCPLWDYWEFTEREKNHPSPKKNLLGITGLGQDDVTLLFKGALCTSGEKIQTQKYHFLRQHCLKLVVK